jgi:hypothetical protein
MIGAFSILAAVAALAVSAAPVGSAGTSKKPPQASYSKAKAAAGGYGARAIHATTQLQMFFGDAYDNEMG